MKIAVIPLIGALGLAAPAAPAAEPQRPNIVFIFSDDHAQQAIGAYPTWLSNFVRAHAITPNIDRLADEGALFTRSFCGNSICSPSRATVLSGVHTHISGVTRLDGGIREGVWTFPPALQAAGYQTAIVGKWHMAQRPAGFDFWRILPGQGSYWNPSFAGPDGFKEKVEGYATDIITDKAVTWLKNCDKSRPFVLLTHHKAPHRPWNPPARYYSLLADVQVPEPPTLFDDYAGRTSSARNQKMEIARHMGLPGDLKVLPPGKYPGSMNAAQGAAWTAAFQARNEAFVNAGLKGDALTRWKYQEYMKDYLRCIKAVDDGVGRLLECLKEEGLAENTIVVYSADQGFFLGEHGWFDKRWIYEESLAMPLIVRWPGVVKPGARIPQLVQNIDYAPTFMEMAGAPVPGSVQGRSLLPLLRGEVPVDWRKSIYYRYYDPFHNVQKHYGLRTERYTLAYFHPVDEWELFDLEKDPREMHSVYDEPAYARTVTELKGELTRLRTFYKDADEPAASSPKARRN